MTSSTKASRVPEVGGGPSTSIFDSGSDLSISDQFLYGLATILPSTTTFLASALKISSLVRSTAAPDLELASTIPSKPILISTGVTPAALQVASSASLMGRDAFAKSGVPSPTPAQNSFMPPPVPVDSTTGVLNLPAWPSFSATAVVKGNTVDEPTICI